jgi:hypothetical protein
MSMCCRTTSIALASPKPGADLVERPISSLIHPIASSSVPISGPRIYSDTSAIVVAKARISRSLSRSRILGRQR